MSCRVPSFALPVLISANEEYLLVEVDRPTSLCFAGVVPDSVVFANEPVGTYAGLEVFTRRDLFAREQLLRWLGDHAYELSTLIEPERERFLVARNRSVFLLTTHHVEQLSHRLSALVTLLQRLPALEANEQEDAALSLPDELADLSPMLAEWGVPDDERRSELVEAASDQALMELINRVAPHLEQINILLDHENSSALDGLAQAVLEAEFELWRRRRQP